MRPFFAALLAFCLLPCTALADQHWLVVSDIHLNPYDADPDPASYRTDTNWPLFVSTVREMQRVQPEPGVVIISGDFLAHEWDAKVRAAGGGSPITAAETTMRRMASLFAKSFPHAQFVVVIGNNDDPCGDYRSTPGTPYYRGLAKIWQPLVDRNDAAPLFARDFAASGACRARLPIPGVQAVAIDDVPWSFVYRRCSRALRDPAGAQFAFLKQALRLPGLRTIVVMHIPPGVDASTTNGMHRFLIVPYLAPFWTRAFASQMRIAQTRVPFAIAGHIHRNGFRLAGGVPLLISPAISPIYGNSPGFLQLDVADDGTLHDYRQYAFDEIAQSWMPQIDFNQTFGTTAFTGPQLLALHERLGRDPELRASWNDLSMNSGAYREFGPGSWLTFWCAQTALDDSFAQCAGAKRRAELLPAAAGILAALFIAAVTLLVLRLARHRRA